MVRSRDSERTIQKTFASVRAQTIEAELIAVDSGSRDRTLEIARRWCDQVLELVSRVFLRPRVEHRSAGGDRAGALRAVITLRAAHD